MSIDKYASMQKNYYERESSSMNKGNHQEHNTNPDYKGVLLKSLFPIDKEKKIFEFGYGCGRNIINIRKEGYVYVDGCDISDNNRKHSEINLIKECDSIGESKLYVTNGLGIDGVESEQYDFIFSTIVMQHICSYDARFVILKDMYRILNKGGELSIQMGFDENFDPSKASQQRLKKFGYYENKTDAIETNGFCDVEISDPQQIIGDLEKIGFMDIVYEIRPPWSDSHANWIFVKAKK
jgi:SAM-dependent methyltransferase